MLVTPGDIQPDPDGRITWWKPTLGDSICRVGWAWMWVLAPVFLAALLVVIQPWLGPLALIWGIKLWALLIAAAVALVFKGVQLAAKARREPFCIHCGYTLTGLPDHHICPECGRPYSFALVEEYRKDPMWFAQRWKIARGTQPSGAPFEARKTRRRSRDGT
jgi:hypothetical protein